jgi:hypothetical protein
MVNFLFLLFLRNETYMDIILLLDKQNTYPIGEGKDVLINFSRKAWREDNI